MYAIQVFFVDGWVYILNPDSEIKKFETKTEAIKYSNLWKLRGREKYVRVVPV